MEKDNDQKQSLREKIVEMQKSLRDVERSIVEVNLENHSLQAVLTGEKELKEDRNNEEVYAYSLVAKDLKSEINGFDEEKRRLMKQKEVLSVFNQALDK